MPIFLDDRRVNQIVCYWNTESPDILEILSDEYGKILVSQKETVAIRNHDLPSQNDDNMDIQDEIRWLERDLPGPPVQDPAFNIEEELV